MKTSPGLLGAALLFWGWQVGLAPLAFIIALLLEASRLVGWRWTFTRADSYRVADLCRLVLLAMAIYLVAARGPAEAVFGLIQWFPLAVLPLVICQLYGAGGQIDLRAFFLILRREARHGADDAPRPADFTYPYFALSILAASAANVRTGVFFVGFLLLSAWALWSARSRRFSPVLWAGLLLVAGALGYAGQTALHNLQKALERTVTAWYFSDLLSTDPFRTSTAIGELGTVKLSDRIALRVWPGPGVRPPLLLREAGYNVYKSATWFAADSSFQGVPPEPDGTTWSLRAGIEPSRSLTIWAGLQRGAGMLALPSGAWRVEELRAGTVKQTGSGAVKVEDSPSSITYRVLFHPDVSTERAPTEADLAIPKDEAPVIARVVAELGLETLPPHEAVKAVVAFFEKNFRYSTFLGDRPTGSTPLETFLFRSRAGHCEYFATATVLLLRAAGIPARYAVGYSVQEWSGLENLYVVRARHAHSWARAYLRGAWWDLDTTPAVWVEVERGRRSSWEVVHDLWSWAVFRLSQWRWPERAGGFTRYGRWLLAPLLAFLVWWVWRRKRVPRRRPEPAPARPVPARPGVDSEFYAIERRMDELGLGRHPWESPRSWVQRIRAAHFPRTAADALSEIVLLHYRYRFDPTGIGHGERQALRSLAESWLEAEKSLDRRDPQGAPESPLPPHGQRL